MQLTVAHLDRSHRLGPKKKENSRPRKRAIIVRFRSEAILDEVFRGRAQLKRHNSIDKDKAIFINEDLTAKRASLAYKTRLLKRENNRCLLNLLWKSSDKNNQWSYQGNPRDQRLGQCVKLLLDAPFVSCYVEIDVAYLRSPLLNNIVIIINELMVT